MMRNILITSGGGLQGQTLIKELSGLQDVIVHVCDIYTENVTKYLTPFYTQCPASADKKAYLDFLINYCSENSISFILPASIYDLQLLAKEKKRFTNTDILVSDISLLNILMDKEKTYKWLLSNGIKSFKPIPKSELINSLPVIGKLRNSWGGKNSRIIYDQSDLPLLTKKEFETLFFTSYLKYFNEYSIDFVINHKGLISEKSIRKRLRVLGGFSIVSEEIVTIPTLIKDIVDSTTKLLACNGGLGYFNMQILETADQIFVSDINPRIGTSSVHAHYLNLQQARFLFDEAINSSPLNISNFKSIRYLKEFTIIQRFDKQKVKAVVFDLDDTLMPVKEWIYTKIKYVADKFEKYVSDKTEFIEDAQIFIEEGKTFILFDELAKKHSLEKYKPEMIECYRNYIPQNVHVFNDVLSILLYLKTRYKLAVLTDNPIFSQKQKIEQLNIAGYFDAIVYTRELGSQKPDKICFERVSGLLDLRTDEMVMVGDNFHRDVKGAIRADYAHAFHIIRKYSLLNTSSIKSNYEGKYTEIKHLNQLSWYL